MLIIHISPGRLQCKTKGALNQMVCDSQSHHAHRRMWNVHNVSAMKRKADRTKMLDFLIKLNLVQKNKKEYIMISTKHPSCTRMLMNALFIANGFKNKQSKQFQHAKKF